jgi:hypothetical protein
MLVFLFLTSILLCIAGLASLFFKRWRSKSKWVLGSAVSLFAAVVVWSANHPALPPIATEDTAHNDRLKEETLARVAAGAARRDEIARQDAEHRAAEQARLAGERARLDQEQARPPDQDGKSSTADTSNEDLQKAFNYLFTQDVDGSGVVIEDKEECLVRVRTLFATHRYFFRKMNLESATYTPEFQTYSSGTETCSTYYSGSSSAGNVMPSLCAPTDVAVEPYIKITIKGDEIIEDEIADKDHAKSPGRKQMALRIKPDDLSRFQSALSYISARCPYNGKKLPF